MDFDAATDRRRQTRGNIYRYIYDAKGFCSRQSLARELNLSLPTVYQNLSQLMEAGLIRDSGGGSPPAGGKRAGCPLCPMPGWRWGSP